MTEAERGVLESVREMLASGFISALVSGEIMPVAYDTTWIRFMRENPHLRASFFEFMKQTRADTLSQFVSCKEQNEIWRLQGGVRAIDFITAFVTKQLESFEGNNAGRVDHPRESGHASNGAASR